jgi:NAD(P)-dependent dehydrogenase (short-subunit alcohol dehydrogenase family)
LHHLIITFLLEETMSEGNNRLGGKKALVTGAGTGIGQEIALEYARQGAEVVLHFFHSGDGAKETVEKIKLMDGKAAALEADFDKVQPCFDLVDQAIEILGGLDVLVNNAGYSLDKNFLETTPEEFNFVFNVNIRAQFFCAQQAVKYWLKENRKGNIINLASIDGLRGNINKSAYSGTKGAVIAWTRELGVELAAKGIRVNAIAPGWIEVARNYRDIKGFNGKTAGTIIPLQRIGHVSDIAKAAVYLGSDESEFMIGQTMIVDGGTTAKMALDFEQLQFG